MRTQTTKTLPKKGALLKSNFKQQVPAKQVKKKLISNSNNVKNSIKKTELKNIKKKKVANIEGKNDDSDDSSYKSESKADTAKSPLPTKSTAPVKNKKIENKEKSMATKRASVLATKKKHVSQNVKTTKIQTTISQKLSESGDEIKYKINSGHTKLKKRTKIKNNTKALSIKKGTASPQTEPLVENEDTSRQPLNSDTSLSTKPIEEDINEEVSKSLDNSNVTKITIKTNDPLPPVSQKPKSDIERPPKFFTSTRSPRIVDIDLKSCKTTKSNLHLTDRIPAIKTAEGKGTANLSSDSKLGELCNSSAEPEIDVYTFTDYKVDSPKSILPDFRSPIGKSVGRVRPIARVKGTVIDKNKGETEKKKYSPHRPIEEVVKQLKAGKKAEEARLLALTDKVETSSGSSICSYQKKFSDPNDDDKPKGVVSKSYKMVARKSNIPGSSAEYVIPPNIESSEKLKETSRDKQSKISTSKSKTAQHNKILNANTTKDKNKKTSTKTRISDEDIDHSTFSLNTSSTSHPYSSSDESGSNSDTKESSDSEDSVQRRFERKRKKGKKICDSERKSISKDLEPLSPDSLVDLKESSSLLQDEKPSKRRLKMISMWKGPKKHRMASLNALAKVHCLYENESRSHSELGLMRTVERNVPLSIKPPVCKKKLKPEKHDSTSESEYEKKDKMTLESSEEDTPPPTTRNLRVVPGARGSGKYWDHKSSTSSSEDSEAEYKKPVQTSEKRKPTTKASAGPKPDTEKPLPKIKKPPVVVVKKKRNRNEVVMDLKDMVVQKRMASLNATAILAASYEKRSPKSNKDDTTTSDSSSDKDETYLKKSKNGVATGVKSEAGIKIDECKKESECTPPKQKVEVIVNQDTDVTITGVYSTHHEGFCTVSGLKYRISSTSHTQTTATASSEKEGCSHDDSSRYTPLNALSSMQPPPVDPSAPSPHPQSHPGHEHRGLGLGRRPGCSSAFSAPPPTHPHHEPGYYQPAGPLIKEGASEEARALARYHPHAPPPHYHHPPMVQHYGSPYYPELCYGRYYPRPGPYLPASQPAPDTQMVGVAAEYPPPPPQYYPGAPCYHNTHQRVPYLEYRACPCPMNSCPKNVHIGPATGKPPSGGGPVETPTVIAPPGGAFRGKARAAREPDNTISSGKDPPPEPPAAAYHPPHPTHNPPFSGVSPKRELCEDFRVSTEGLAVEALGPPSPARGSAGACVPQPPPPPPARRARIGKAMVRKTLVGEDTALMMCPQRRPAPVVPAPAPPPEDDDVLVVSSPDVECTPIDLSSSDETERRESDTHERLLPDIKKENEGPDGGKVVRKAAPTTEAQALREHNSPCVPPQEPVKPDPPKPPVKRRYSRPKLEVEPSLELVDGRPTNGIGEHVKLQKRRKLVPETETMIEEAKKKSPTKKKTSKVEPEAKRCNKRKSPSGTDAPLSKRIELEPPKQLECADARLQNPAAVCNKPKIKSALLLDKLIRKNSVDREIGDYEPDPAELFLPSVTSALSHSGLKNVLNINNNIVGEKVIVNDTRPADPVVPRLIADRILAKIEAEKQAYKLAFKSSTKTPSKTTSKPLSNKNSIKSQTPEESKNNKMKEANEGKTNKKYIPEKKSKSPKINDLSENLEINQNKISDITTEKQVVNFEKVTEKNPSTKTDSKVPTKNETVKSVEKSKLLPAKNDAKHFEKSLKLMSSKPDSSDPSEKAKCSKTDILKPIEKVSKLICSKSEAKGAEASDVMEEVITAGAGGAKRAAGRRRSVGPRRRQRPLAGAAVTDLPALPALRTQPKWSNGWTWEGEPFIAKIYLNNDMRQDGLRRCYPGMAHAGGDRVRRGDCVLLRAAARRGPEQPYVARVAHLWENPDDGEMMVSLVWYYRPEHTQLPRAPHDAPDEVFASRHRDANSVACIEDKCYVLTFNEYCRYRKRLRAAEQGVRPGASIVPPPPDAPAGLVPADARLPPGVSPELVLFCRKIYDFRSKKIHVPNK